MPLRPVFSPVAIALALASACALAAAPAAQASFPGVNGPILFSQYTAEPYPGEPNDFVVVGDLRSVMPDGSGNRVLANEKDVSEDSAVASPDGRRIVYAKGRELWTSAIDGTGAKVLTGREYDAATPSWSPDGRTVVFSSEERGIFSVGIDASGQATGGPSVLVRSRYARTGRSTFEVFGDPQFTPDGASLRYVRVQFRMGKRLTVSTSIWQAGADGTNPSRAFRGSGDARTVLNLDVSPDGTRVAFLATSNWKRNPRRAFVANLDGSAPRAIAVAGRRSSFADLAWSPDGASLVISEQRNFLNEGSELQVVDVASGAKRTVARTPDSPIFEVSWAPQPKG